MARPRLPGFNSGIYTITHVATGRRYVGSAVDLRKRWKEHRRGLDSGKHHSRFLQRQWAKDGADAFKFTVALYCDRENLLMYEQALIDFYMPEYNSAPKAGSQLGYRHSAETRKRMSQARRKDFSPMAGRHHTDETRRRISEKKRGVKQDPAVVARRKASLLTRPIPPSPARVFDAEQIRGIRSRIAAGEKQRTLCDEFGVSSSVMSEINTRKAYRWVA
jgi:group I intron endonuclease